jgi:tetratricopeptide (TPR) repeat protein
MKYCFYILFALLVGAGRLLAAGVADQFSDANQYYAEGKFADAAKGYEAILSSGTVSPNLFFNYGDAEFKSGNLGQAIAAYRQAALLAPRDAEVRANLEFARNQVQGATLHEGRWTDWLSTLTLNEWTALAAIAFWLAFGLFAAIQIRPALRSALGGVARYAAVAAVLLCACLGLATAIHSSKQVAVVVMPDAVTRSGPFDDAQNAFAVHDGAELPVLDRHAGWVEVSDASGRTGWMLDSQVEVLPEI